jgi:1,4-dihydroxy-2-naphthoate octaprenyltransferase
MSNIAETTAPASASSARGPVSLWLQAVRAFSFTASVIPVLLGGMLALGAPAPRHFWLLPLAVLGGLALHAGTNLLNDYYDFERGVDREGTRGSSGVLVAGMLSPASVRVGGIACFGLAVALAIPVVVVHGWPVLALGGVGLLGGYLYTGRPVAYKYVALGDPLVFLLMGPLMVIGGYLAVTGTWTASVLLASLPIGCLVAAILAANNLRDVRDDAEAGVTTIARLLGHRGGQLEYAALVVGAYALVGVIAVFGLVPGGGPPASAPVVSAWLLLPLLSAPLALKAVSTVLRSRPGDSAALVGADVLTAQLHLVFGLLLIAAVVLQALW